MSDCKTKNGNCTVTDDPDDGLPVQCVGAWAKHKYHYFANYLAATRSVRAGFVHGADAGGAALIDLFSGPGRARIRDNGEIVDGSPLIALAEENFTDIILCDLDPENVSALRQRTAHTRKVQVIEGDCNEMIDAIVAKIPRRAYSIALLDPFGPGALAFNTIRRLAAFPRMDLIIHFPVGSMKRNWHNQQAFERYLGLPVKDWGVDLRRAQDIRELMPVMRRQLISIGYEDHQIAVRAPRVMNSSNTVLYNLMFASKHFRGDTIWNSVTKNEPNGQMRLL